MLSFASEVERCVEDGEIVVTGRVHNPRGAEPILIVKRWNPECDAPDEMQWGGFWARPGDLEGYGTEPPFFAAKCPKCMRLIWETGACAASIADAVSRHQCSGTGDGRV